MTVERRVSKEKQITRKQTEERHEYSKIYLKKREKPVECRKKNISFQD